MRNRGGFCASDTGGSSGSQTVLVVRKAIGGDLQKLIKQLFTFIAFATFSKVTIRTTALKN